MLRTEHMMMMMMMMIMMMIRLAVLSSPREQL